MSRTRACWGTVITWPLSWPDVARDALAADGSNLDDSTAAALMRVQRLSRRQATQCFAGAELKVGASTESEMIRGFDETPREEGEIGLRASWMTHHLSLNLQPRMVTNPTDDKTFRPDGSYLGLNVGNFMVSVGYMERWWGPGWEGSLILSTNARPIPTLTLERNYTDPFNSRWLSWIGPWRASIALGRAEKNGVAVPDVRFLAARVNFKPRPWLEIALSRTAQWCGGERECGWNTLKNLLIGRDNSGDSLQEEDEPGNQLAGYEARLRSPWRKLPIAVYTQWIGEDEAGDLPSSSRDVWRRDLGSSRWANPLSADSRIRVEVHRNRPNSVPYRMDSSQAILRGR